MRQQQRQTFLNSAISPKNRHKRTNISCIDGSLTDPLKAAPAPFQLRSANPTAWKLVTEADSKSNANTNSESKLSNYAVDLPFLQPSGSVTVSIGSYLSRFGRPKLAGPGPRCLSVLSCPHADFGHSPKTAMAAIGSQATRRILATGSMFHFADTATFVFNKIIVTLCSGLSSLKRAVNGWNVPKTFRFSSLLMWMSATVCCLLAVLVGSSWWLVDACNWRDISTLRVESWEFAWQSIVN